MISPAVTAHQYTLTEHCTWKRLYERLEQARQELIHPLFREGLARLPIPHDRVPNLDLVNDELSKITGFKGVWVDGHEDPKSFFVMLKNRQFPIGNFIRSPEDLGYTPAPDVFHDLYGHLPFLANPEYANFIQYFGEVATPYLGQADVCRQFERLFWFGVEFSLINTPTGNKVFGAGLASSMAETEYALSNEPTVIPFSIEKIRHQEFKIDEFQKRIFLIHELRDLYGCLNDFERGIQL